MRFVLLVSFLLSVFQSFTQTGSTPAYPKGYFRYPLDIAPRLNANFGEMRPNHFHMGLDLFTQRKENLPVSAAADGYITRVKIEPGGFGRAIHINHPNGLTTLYAHMNDFMPELEKYVREKQYQLEQWQMELEIQEGQFPVTSGQFIGYSGNTGGSLGPHVHFEIRETASEKCLNPLLFGFDIPDNVPPDVLRLAIYNRNFSLYDQNPVLVPLGKISGTYVSTGVVRVNTDKISLAIQGTDRMSGVPNANGIFSTRLYDDDKLIAGFDMDQIGYDETRYLNGHIDYKFKAAGEAYLQNVFPLPGDHLGIYKSLPEKSFIELTDTSVHLIKIEVADPYGNTSLIKFSLQKNNTVPGIGSISGYRMKPGEINVFETENLQLFLPEKCLYDSINFLYSSTANITPLAFSPLHQLHNNFVPVHENFSIRIRPDKVIPYHLRDRLLIKTITRNEMDVKKVNWELGWYAASFRDFGLFQLVADDQPPLIFAWGLKNGANLSRSAKIVISIRDNYDVIKNFRAELDGKWLMFSQKRNTFTYKFDEHCPEGEHELKITVEDEAGNVAEKKFEFVR